MNRFVRIAAAAALCASTTPLLAQSTQAENDVARQRAVIHEAMTTYNSAVERLQPATAAAPGQPATGRQSPGGERQLTLEEAVSLTLERNLDIQVSRLEPGSADLQVAGIRNTWKPSFISTFGQREQVVPGRDQISGGSAVSNDTTTYNFSIGQPLSWGGGSYNLGWTNARLFTDSTLTNFNPSYTSFLTGSIAQPLLRGFTIDNTRQQLQVALINRDIADESMKATVVQTVANARNAYWDLVFARSAVDVARRALELADRLVADNQARVEVGTLAPLDIVQAQAEAATRRQTLAAAEATASTSELALKRFIVSGTDDPVMRQELVPVDLPSLEAPPTDVEGAISRAIAERTDIQTSRRNLDTNDVNLRFFRNQTLPALDLNASYGAQGLGGTTLVRAPSSGGLGGNIIDTIPGGYSDALSRLWDRAFPTWNLSMTMTYPLFGNQADAQLARARVQRSQAQTRLRALEVQIAAEVANAAFTVQSNLKRVEASTAARELALKRLEAEQSRFEVGLSTNFFVVQAQRDLRDAENTELRALADYRKSLVTYERSQLAPAGGSGGGATALNTTGTAGTTTQQQ